MKEELIKFETAKLAEEKGFDISTYHAYDVNNELVECTASEFTGKVVNFNAELLKTVNSIKGSKRCYLAPTQSLLQKWLREVHKFHINIISMKSGVTKVKYCVYITETRANYPQTPRKKGFKTYEEALEYGLFTTLNLVEL
jgi:hypothetical protein